MSETLYYKVFRVHNGHLYSAHTWWEIEYKLNLPNTPHPESGPLCVFDTLRNAMIFCDFSLRGRPHDYVIYSCVIEPSWRGVVWYVNHTKRVLIPDLGKGTVLAASVTLKDHIQDYHNDNMTPVENYGFSNLVRCTAYPFCPECMKYTRYTEFNHNYCSALWNFRINENFCAAPDVIEEIKAWHQARGESP